MRFELFVAFHVFFCDVAMLAGFAFQQEVRSPVPLLSLALRGGVSAWELVLV
jgi:hypothetical protein